LAIDGLAGRASTPNGWKYAATSGVLWNDWLMGRYVINASARSNAPTQAIWDVVADVATWQNWGPYSKTYLESEGTPTPDGVGAIRAYAVGPVTSREQVTIYEPPHRLGYHILSGFPVKDYNALVTLEPVEGGRTDVHWRAEFDGKPRGTGWFMRIAMVPYLSYLARKTGKVASRSDS
jgi:hypothetical protein